MVLFLCSLLALSSLYYYSYSDFFKKLFLLILYFTLCFYVFFFSIVGNPLICGNHSKKEQCLTIPTPISLPFLLDSPQSKQLNNASYTYLLYFFHVWHFDVFFLFQRKRKLRNWQLLWVQVLVLAHFYCFPWL